MTINKENHTVFHGCNNRICDTNFATSCTEVNSNTTAVIMIIAITNNNNSDKNSNK